MSTNRTALTALELTISLAIISVIGLSAAGVTLVLSESHAQTESKYNNTQAGRGALAVMQKYINEARLVTAVEGNSIVLWHRDRNEDGKINLSELVMLTHDRELHVIKKVRVMFPAGMDPQTRAALDYELPLFKLTETIQVVEYIQRDSRSIEQVIVENVREFKAFADLPCPMTRMVRLYLIVGDTSTNSAGEYDSEDCLVLQTAAALRVDDTERVMTDAGGQYILDEKDDSYWTQNSSTYPDGTTKP